MRFLADAGISPRTVDYLRRNGHDAIHVREIGMQRAADRVLVEKAQADDRILLTLDLNFWRDICARSHRAPERRNLSACG